MLASLSRSLVALAPRQVELPEAALPHLLHVARNLAKDLVERKVMPNRVLGQLSICTDVEKKNTRKTDLPRVVELVLVEPGKARDERVENPKELGFAAVLPRELSACIEVGDTRAR